MKMLNLDKLGAAEQRELVLCGTTYAIGAMSVENFVATTRAAEKLGAEASIADQIEATVEMVKRAVPEIDAAVLSKLSLPQLQAIVAFVRGDDVEGQEETPVEGDEGKK